MKHEEVQGIGVPQDQIEMLYRLVGPMTPEQMENLGRNLESYIHRDLSIFVPLYSYCGYAVSPDHVHPGYSFIFNQRSNGYLKVEGQKVRAPAHQNICCFSPGVQHQEVNEEGFSKYQAVFIDKEYFEAQWELSAEPGEAIPVWKGNFVETDESLIYFLRMMMAEYQQKGAVNLMPQMIPLFTQYLVRHLRGGRGVISPWVNKRLEEALHLMYENIDGKLKVSDLAERANMSESHFSKAFKESLGKSPLEYLNGLRLEKARHMLKSSDKNLSEIAYACGFNTSSYFSRYFRSVMGCSPREYQKSF
jgi:AraC-like DNA-binding protein